jgi:hypothetical protein
MVTHQFIDPHYPVSLPDTQALSGLVRPPVSVPERLHPVPRGQRVRLQQTGEGFCTYTVVSAFHCQLTNKRGRLYLHQPFLASFPT